ncbi:hypothetical protein [Lichenicoccus sp.]|uniref:antitoxin Xre/MbcA/ParS-like domain-containing protein n=1 Tax=Lichenicoccus sp. TaxID=2781899 RepID=UPI003D1005F2
MLDATVHGLPCWLGSPAAKRERSPVDVLPFETLQELHQADDSHAKVEQGRLEGTVGARTVRFNELVAQIAAEPETAQKPLKLVAKAAAEVSQGAGLDQVLSPEEGRARIGKYATPTKVEDWAGSLAGPTELERDFGVARSTLHTWQKQGAVIGLLVGVRKHTFPTEQFVDGRPVAGLAAIVKAIGNLRVAWLWLREPNPGFAGVTPLARLKAGATDKVVEMAHSNFADA